MRILIVDDEIKIREVVKEYSKVNGYDCDEASNGKEAIEKVRNNNYDCVILDIMMPVLDGYTACKRIKEISDVPVIMLSARQEEDDKLFSFDIGVDDYVTKPFSPKELMARVKAISLRKNKGKGEIQKFKGLEIDIDGKEVYVNKKKVDMTPKEKELLFYLVENKNIALDREKILRAVWHVEYFGEDRTVDTHIKMLRKSLGKYKDYIKTVRGTGYKFEA